MSGESLTSFLVCLALVHLHRDTEEEGDEVHDGEAWEQLPLQEHGRVVMVTVLHCGIMMV